MYEGVIQDSGHEFCFTVCDLREVLVGNIQKAVLEEAVGREADEDNGWEDNNSNTETEF